MAWNNKFRRHPRRHLCTTKPTAPLLKFSTTVCKQEYSRRTNSIAREPLPFSWNFMQLLARRDLLDHQEFVFIYDLLVSSWVTYSSTHNKALLIVLVYDNRLTCKDPYSTTKIQAPANCVVIHEIPPDAKVRICPRD